MPPAMQGTAHRLGRDCQTVLRTKSPCHCGHSLGLFSSCMRTPEPRCSHSRTGNAASRAGWATRSPRKRVGPRAATEPPVCERLGIPGSRSNAPAPPAAMRVRPEGCSTLLEGEPDANAVPSCRDLGLFPIEATCWPQDLLWDRAVQALPLPETPWPPDPVAGTGRTTSLSFQLAEGGPAHHLPLLKDASPLLSLQTATSATTPAAPSPPQATTWSLSAPENPVLSGAIGAC